MRTIIISDDDQLIGKLTETNIDLLISLGDLWDGTIKKAIERYQPKLTIAIRGNHDTPRDFPSNIVDLHRNTYEFDGIKFGGFCGSWQYKPSGHYLFEQHEATQLLNNFPPVDVFIAHNSPRRIHERDEDIHQGFDALRSYIELAQPDYFFHGHQHVNQTTQIGATKVIGVYGERFLELELSNKD